MSIAANAIDRIDDNLNPIIVKELRQVVRGRFFWGVLILFLVIQCMILSLAIADHSPGRRSAGAETLTFLYAILFLASYVLIPLNTGFRFAREQSDGSEELLYITTITPSSIIAGKFAASMAIILLLFSAFAPFMAMTFFLSGVDFNATIFILLLGLIISAGGTIFQICLGGLAKDAHTMQLFRIAGFGFQFLTYFSLNAASSELTRYGIDRLFGGGNALEAIVTFLVIFAALGWFLFVAAVAAIAPVGSNRMLPVRRCLSWVWLVTLALSAYWALESGSGEAFLPWGYLVVNFLSIFALIAVSERDVLTDRVARDIPHGRFNGLKAFLYCSGAAGGLAWIACILVLTVLAVSVLMSLMPNPTGSVLYFSDFIFYSAGFVAYAFGYALLATFFRRTFLQAYVSSRNTWVVALMMCGIFSMAPIFFGSLAGLDSNTILIGNPISLLQRGEKELGMVFAMGMLLIGFIVNLPWLSSQYKEFCNVWLRTPEPEKIKDA